MKKVPLFSKDKKKKKAIGAIYSHPELYPPTLNAIQNIAIQFDEVYLICNNVVKSEWNYPQNIKLIPVGPYLPIKEFEQKSIFWKFFRFINYIITLLRFSKKATLIITYDVIPLFAYGLIQFFSLRKNIIWWYHNHDISPIHTLRVGSIGWLATKLEPVFFKKIDVFSLPSEERKIFFPMDKLKGKYFFIPNFPSKKVYKKLLDKLPLSGELKLIYQGSISINHGLEAIIPLLGVQPGFVLKLNLIGKISDEYRKELEELAHKENKSEWLKIMPAVNYAFLPAITAQHHVGLALHQPKGEIYATAGTASNKIYEYAACGLPVIYFDSDHYRHHLGQYAWAFATDLSLPSLMDVLHIIVSNYQEISAKAQSDFQNHLNFERHFEAPFETIQSILK
jgi:hypothetical protein